MHESSSRYHFVFAQSIYHAITFKSLISFFESKTCIFSDWSSFSEVGVFCYRLCWGGVHKKDVSAKMFISLKYCKWMMSAIKYRGYFTIYLIIFNKAYAKLPFWITFDNKHWMAGPKGNSEFCFPETLKSFQRPFMKNIFLTCFHKDEKRNMHYAFSSSTWKWL